MLAAVIIVEAPPGKILTLNRQAQQMRGQNLEWSMSSELGNSHDLCERSDLEMPALGLPEHSDDLLR
jgi:hypothetical protein